MPDATVSHELHHYDLKSLPGGWVKLRQLSYYEMLVRRDKGSTASMEQSTKLNNNRNETVKMYLDTLQTWDRDYLFKNCVAEHNLTDAAEQPLNFNNKNTLNMLNPKVAFEIEKYIDDLNGPEDELTEDFPSVASNSSEHQNQEQLISEESLDLTTN